MTVISILSTRWIASLGLGFAALALGGGIFYQLSTLKQPPEARAPGEKVYQVEVFDVERADLREIVSGFGTVRADREVVISAQVTGQVVMVNPRLKIGEHVQAVESLSVDSTESIGSHPDVLLTIDSDRYAQRVRQTASRIAQDGAELKRLDQEKINNDGLLKLAKQDYEAFKKEYDREKSLRDGGLSTASRLVRANLELRIYRRTLARFENEDALYPQRREVIVRRLESLEIEKSLAEIDLEHTRVVPSFTGILSQVSVELGQFVQPGEPLFRLIDTSKVEIPIALPLDDFAKIAPLVRSGYRPVVTLAENEVVALAEYETREHRWRGHVVRVAPEADRSTRTVNVFVEVDNQKQSVPLLPGCFVQARIEGPLLDNQIVIPRSALTRGRLFVAKQGQAHICRPQLERALHSMVLVKSGLEPGDQVILTNLDVIHRNASIRIRSHSKLRDELSKQSTIVFNDTVAD